jgi:hypothetical protein
MCDEGRRPLIRNATACDRSGCGTWSRSPEEHGFLEVVWGSQRLGFCGVDCLLQELAQRSQPSMTMPM